MDATDLQSFQSFAQIGFSALAIITIVGGLLMLSAYIKIVTVLHILRLGLGIDSLPGVVVTGALALSLTFFVMTPTIERSVQAIKADTASAAARAQSSEYQGRVVGLLLEEWKPFLLQHASVGDRKQFSELILEQTHNSADSTTREALEQSWRVLVPSFVVSQLREAFQVGLRLLLPLLVIDLLVGAIFSAISFEKLSPSIVSFPLKLLLFVSVDGWTLITSNLLRAYGGA